MFHSSKILILIPVILIPVILSGCKIGTPFSGPATKRPPGPGTSPDDPVVVGLTYVVVGKDKKRAKTFWSHVWNVKEAMQDQPGFLGAAVRRKVFGKEAWTLSVWEDDQSVDAFVGSSYHRKAMKEGWPALTTARFARIQVTRSEIPISWKRAEQILAERGRAYVDRRKGKRAYPNTKSSPPHN